MGLERFISSRNVKRLGSLALVPTLFFGSVSATEQKTRCGRHGVDRQGLTWEQTFIRSHVANYFDSLLVLQEKNLGIKHESVPSCEFRKLRHNEPVLAARYDPDEEVIIFYEGFEDEDRPFSDITSISNGRYNYLIAHELGHHYANQYAKRINEEADFTIGLLNSPSKNRRARYKLLVEGVAEYVEKRTAGTDTTIAEESLKNISADSISLYVNEPHVFQFKAHSPYALGYGFVKPILSIDFHRGLDYLTRHELLESDLPDITHYQKTAINSLRAKAVARR